MKNCVEISSLQMFRQSKVGIRDFRHNVNFVMYIIGRIL
jgi:hypothetical protein